MDEKKTPSATDGEGTEKAKTEKNNDGQKQASSPKSAAASDKAPNGKPRAASRRTGGKKYEGKNLDFSQAAYDESLVGEKLDSESLPKPPSINPDDYAEANFAIPDRVPTRGKRGASPYRETTFKSVIRKYTGKLWFRVGVSVAAVFAVILLVFQIYLRVYSDVKTEVAAITDYMETIDVEGVAIRDEHPINETRGKYSVNVVTNGEKVSNGQTIINVFNSSEAAAAYERIAEIDRQIAELQGMVTASEDSANAVTNIERLLDEQVASLNAVVCRGDLSHIADIKNNLSYLLNKRLVAMRKVEDYQDRIDALESEKQSLQSAYAQSPAAIAASDSGYYVNALDGYENLLNPSMLDDLTADKLEKIMNRQVSVSANSAGKLLGDFNWYLACPVPIKQAEDYLAVNSVYTLLLPYSETGSLQATLVSLNRADENDDTFLAVFKCSSLLSELCSIRRQPVKIQIRSYRGYSVKKSALHVMIRDVDVTDDNGDKIGTREERLPCVYVVMAGQIYAKRVKVIYNNDQIAICSISSDSNYLELYDEVITEGRDLYAGKIVR